MYIEPNTIIRILKNCPINATYQHTIYFTDKQAQTNYFTGLTKHTLNRQTFQRHSNGIMTVQVKVEDLYDCNYLMFQNVNFGGKWFYAFITNVEYVNNISSRITFEIDVMQTWFFDYELLPSFVVREHSVNDIIGENTVPEGLEHGEYITTAYKPILATDYRIGILATEQNPTPDDSLATFFRPPAKVCGYPINCYWWFSAFDIYNDTTFQQLNSILDAYAISGKSDAIVSIFIFPYNMAGRNDVYEETVTGANRTLSKTPKNNKLYTYPYCCQSVVCDGNAVNLHYELFDNQTPTFNVRATWGVNPKVVMTPTDYQGYPDDFTHSLTLTGFPLMPYIKDYFQNYIGQNWANLTYGTVKDVVNIGVGAVQAHKVTGFNANTGYEYGEEKQGFGKMMESADNLINRGIQIYEHSIIPDTFVGTAEAGDTMVFSGLKGYHTYCRSIKPEFVDRLDSFFDMYGYKTNLLKVPNRNSRPHWNFVQTANCNIKGEMPQVDIYKICSIYNNGITFWKNGNEVGNYSLDNTV